MYTPALVAVLALCLPDLAAGDPREVFGSTSPGWLRAVGKLEVPGIRFQRGYGSHHRENCSATLVATTPTQNADTLISAWHCLEHYADLSKPIVVSFEAPDGRAITREARRIADGGGMYADWAVLKLRQPINRNEVPALTLHPGRASPAQPIFMAGFSGDDGLGAGGDALTYDADCRITRQETGESESNCRAFKGASGGAVIQLDESGKARLCGVISRGDSATVSYFVPLERFRKAVSLSL